jgi:hypothetical protein
MSNHIVQITVGGVILALCLYQFWFAGKCKSIILKNWDRESEHVHLWSVARTGIDKEPTFWLVSFLTAALLFGCGLTYTIGLFTDAHWLIDSHRDLPGDNTYTLFNEPIDLPVGQNWILPFIMFGPFVTLTLLAFLNFCYSVPALLNRPFRVKFVSRYEGTVEIN